MTPLGPVVLFLLILSQPVPDVIVDLGSSSWGVREQASFILSVRMDADLSQLLQVEAVKAKDLEVEHRLRVLLDEYHVRVDPPPPSMMKQVGNAFFNIANPFGPFFPIQPPQQQGN